MHPYIDNVSLTALSSMPNQILFSPKLMEIECDVLTTLTLHALFPIGLVDFRRIWRYYRHFSTVNGENYLYRGCSPFNTDEISAGNRLHDPVCNEWTNEENCKQQCDRDSFCNRGDMKNGKIFEKFSILKKFLDFSTDFEERNFSSKMLCLYGELWSCRKP